jgi:ketosteroid isomerase-like protein
VSQQNVKVVRDLMQGFNDRDEGVLSHYADDVEFRLIGGFSDLAGQNLKGREAILQFAREQIENLGARFEVERLFEANNRVVLIASTVGVGDASGAPVTQRWGQVYTFREGKITAVDNYWEANEALEAVGLRE